MSEPRRNGGDLLVELLRLLDVDAAFGVVSVHNLPLVEALNRDLRWVATRGEAAAVNAADGYGRSRDGDIGFCFGALLQSDFPPALAESGLQT